MNADLPPGPLTEDAALAGLRATLDAQRASFLSALPVDARVREDRLDRALAMLLGHRERLLDAVMQDFPVRDRDWSLIAEIFAPTQVLTDARRNVRRWMKTERRTAPVPFRFLGAKAEVQYQPLGVVGIMGAWNGPLNLVVVPMALALAAGNRTMLCPSDMMPSIGEALDTAVREYFDAVEVAVARGGLATCKAFAKLPFDHLLFTGSPPVGAQVMAQAAPNLVPVTLELGGKCPVIVADDADLADTARALVATKTLNGGQACLSPDLLLVPRAKCDALLQSLDVAAEKLYPGGARNPFWCGIVNTRHFQRVESLVEQAAALGARVEALGMGGDPHARRDEANRRLALHAIVDPPAGSRALHEEIFGPVLTVLTYDDLDAACARLREMPKPLGLYVFSKSSATTRRVLDRTFSGGVTVNDALFHYSVPDLPFGGVGRSGMGAYSFGIEGFRCFSHARSVYRQAGPRALMRVMQPPYTGVFDLVVRRSLDRLARRYARVGRRV